MKSEISKTLREKIRAKLVEKVEQFFDENPVLVEGLDMWFGGNIPEHMADAAMAVLMAQRDVQVYMQENECEIL